MKCLPTPMLYWRTGQSMTEEEFKQLEQFCASLLKEASKDAPAVLDGLRNARGIADDIEKYLAKADASAPGPHTREQIVGGVVRESRVLLSALDTSRLALIDLIKPASSSSEPQQELLRLMRTVHDRGPTPQSADIVKQLMDLGEAGRVLRCVAEFAMASGVFTFNSLFSAYVDAGQALVGSHSDLLLKSVAVTEATAKSSLDIIADISSAGTYSFLRGFIEIGKAARTSNLANFVESIKKSFGIEQLLALSETQTKLLEYSEFSTQIMKQGSEEIRKLTISLNDDVARLKKVIDSS